jgi:hypothetical protein
VTKIAGTGVSLTMQNRLGADWTIWEMGRRDNAAKLVKPPLFSMKSLQSQLLYLRFQSTLLLISMAFYYTKLWSTLKSLIFGIRDGGFEDLMDSAVRKAIYEQTGILLDESAFDG